MENKVLGVAVDLFVSKRGVEKRESQESLVFELDGVCEDKFKGKDTNRSVLLVSQKSYAFAKENKIELSDGDLGENVLVDFDPYSFESGSRLHIGEVILEISQKSSLCSSLSKINNRLPKLLKDKRGIFAKVVCAGTIKKGDTITHHEASLVSNCLE